jgi:hypothetical protein
LKRKFPSDAEARRGGVGFWFFVGRQVLLGCWTESGVKGPLWLFLPARSWSSLEFSVDFGVSGGEEPAGWATRVPQRQRTGLRQTAARKLKTFWRMTRDDRKCRMIPFLSSPVNSSRLLLPLVPSPLLQLSSSSSTSSSCLSPPRLQLCPEGSHHWMSAGNDESMSWK